MSKWADGLNKRERWLLAKNEKNEKGGQRLPLPMPDAQYPVPNTQCLMPNFMRYFLILILISGITANGSLPTHLDRQKFPEGCEICHKSHKTAVRALLKKDESSLCFQCHSDIKKAFEKKSHHILNEKLKCSDCHNPHKSNPQNKLEGVIGRKANGVYGEATQEYEVCFKCHNETSNEALKGVNIPEQFSINNLSYHPVENSGKEVCVPSLIPPLTVESVIKCSDCHSEDGGLVSKGPHGSNYNPILVRHYSTSDGNRESLYQYDLCYGCHDRLSILSNESFPEHREHMTGGTSCFTCHSSHGSKNNQWLIHFNREVVSPDNITGRIEYRWTGVNHGECYLRCHNTDHSPKKY